MPDLKRAGHISRGDSSDSLSDESMDSFAMTKLRKTARNVFLIDRDRISEEDLRDLNNYRSNMIIKKKQPDPGQSPSTRPSSIFAASRKVTLYPVVLEARKVLIQTACLYEGKDQRPIYHRALADTAENLMQRISLEGDFMRAVANEISDQPTPTLLVPSALETFQDEIEQRIDEIRDELDYHV